VEDLRRRRKRRSWLRPLPPRRAQRARPLLRRRLLPMRSPLPSKNSPTLEEIRSDQVSCRSSTAAEGAPL
jgi:hypothetical protein